MKAVFLALAACAVLAAPVAQAHQASPVTVEVIGPDGRVFQEFPLQEGQHARDDAYRSWLQAEQGARYEIRVRNATAERVGVVIAVDGRNIISGSKSDLARGEPMYVLEAGSTQEYAGWRASLQSVNEFYFTDWSDSYAEAFGDRSARGVIALAVYREAQDLARDSSAGAAPAPPATARADRAVEKSAGTGYGDRRVDPAVQVEFVARQQADSRHFIKYEWRDSLCRKRVIDCGEQNRFWDESTLGFAPPPPRRR